MNNFISNRWNKLIHGPYGPSIGLVCGVAMLISALWVLCLMVAVIGWPFMYIIDKIGG